MYRKIALSLLTVSAAFLPYTAHANPQPQGFYLGLGTGVAMPDDADLSGPGIATELDLEEGWDVGTTLGYRYGNGFRSELEVGFFESSVDSLGGASSTGSLLGSHLMLNLLYDYANASAFTPYVGVGGGLISYQLDNLPAVGGGTIDDDDRSWGAQGIVGASYQVNPWFDVYTQYQYIYGDDPELTNSVGTRVDAEYTNNIVQVGFRVALQNPEKVRTYETAPAAPAVSDATYKSVIGEKSPSYLVFFDFDKATLTSEAKDILKKVAGQIREQKVVQVEVTGHADRAGSEKYNQGLSQRRANAVKQELLAQGVSAAEIMTYAKGESQPLVPTPDGVREPQNRRVEIIYSQE